MRIAIIIESSVNGGRDLQDFYNEIETGGSIQQALNMPGNDDHWTQLYRDNGDKDDMPEALRR